MQDSCYSYCKQLIPEQTGIEIKSNRTIGPLLGISPAWESRKVPLIVGILLLYPPTLIQGRKNPTNINEPETKRRLDGCLKKSWDKAGVFGFDSTSFCSGTDDSSVMIVVVLFYPAENTCAGRSVFYSGYWTPLYFPACETRIEYRKICLEVFMYP